MQHVVLHLLQLATFMQHAVHENQADMIEKEGLITVVTIYSSAGRCRIVSVCARG